MRLLPIFIAILPLASLAAECTVKSGPTTAALIELYTSEGCSSCPPADRWLSSFVGRADPERIIPLAFHISYWDYIGWKDRFADARYTERQRALAGARSAYTPQVKVAGRDFHGWRDADMVANAVAAANQKAPRARLELEPRAGRDGAVEGIASAEILPGAKADDLALIVAITQNGLSSRVTAGENKGEKLNHNFVVRDLAVIRDLERKSPPLLRGKFAFKSRPDWGPAQMAVVAFVQNTKTGEVLQAVSAPACRG